MTALKVCGITRPEDLETCRRLGVDAVGINLWAGSRRGLTLPEARALVDAVPGPGPQRVGVFVEPTVQEVERACSELGLDAIQLHDDRDPAPFARLGVPWVRVIRGVRDLDALVLGEPPPAWVLLDALVEGFGGRGRTTDWGWARAAVEHFAASDAAVPVWLAGGITVDNAAQAIASVGPAGLDVASGAELPTSEHGHKDPARIAALLAACRGTPVA